MGASVRPQTYSPDNPFAPKAGPQPEGYSPDNPFAPHAAVPRAPEPQLPRAQLLAGLRNVGLTTEEPGAAPLDESRVGAPPANPQARQLTGTAKFASDVFSAAATPFEHPAETAVGMVTGPAKAAKLLAEAGVDYAAGRPITTSPKQLAIAAAQVGSIAIAGPAEDAIGELIAPYIGSRAAGLLSRTTVAAGVGAAYNPEHPGVGAVVGGAMGAALNEASPMRPTVRRLVTDDPARMLSDETSPRAPTAKLRVLEKAPPPEGPDFTVEQDSYSPDNPFAPKTAQEPPEPVKAPSVEPASVAATAATPAPTGDLLNEYQQSEIGERERVNNATEEAGRRAQFPMTVTNLLDHAEAKGTSIAQSAATLRAAGYTIPPELERDAVKQQMRSQPSSEPAYSSDNPFAQPEKTDLFGNAVRPTVEQGGLFAAGAGTEQSRIDQQQLARKDEAISPEEMAQRRDILGAPKPKEQPEPIADKQTLYRVNKARSQREQPLSQEAGAQLWKDPVTSHYMNLREQSEDAIAAGNKKEHDRLRGEARRYLSKLTPEQRVKATKWWYDFAGDNIDDALIDAPKNPEAHAAAKAGRVRAQAEISAARKLNDMDTQIDAEQYGQKRRKLPASTEGQVDESAYRQTSVEPSREKLPGAVDVDWPFQKIGERQGEPPEGKIPGGLNGPKTGKASIIEWQGRFAGKSIRLRTQARNASPESHFLTSSNARIRGDKEIPNYLDVVVTKGELTDAELNDLAHVAQKMVVKGGTDWPVRIRRKGESLEQGRKPSQLKKPARKVAEGAVNPKYRLDDNDTLLDRAAELEARLEEYSSGAHGGPEYVSSLDRNEVYDPKAMPSAIEHPHVAGTSVRHRLAQDSELYRGVMDELKARGLDEDAIDEAMAKRGRTPFAGAATPASGQEAIPFERSAPGGRVHMETSRGSRSRATSGAPSTPIGSAAGPAKRAPRAAGAHPLPEAPGLEQERSSFRPMEIVRAVKQLLNPESLGAEAQGAAGTIGHEAAISWRKLTISNEALRDFGRYVGRLSKADAVRFWDAAEHGRPTGDPRADQGNALLHKVTEQYTKELIQLDRLKADATIANYVGRFWATKQTSVRDALRILMGKRPFEGPKSFTKHRSLVNFTDGLDAGLVPQTYNYVDAQLAKMAEMQRVIAAEKMLRQEAEFGRAKKVMTSLGHEPPVDAEGEKWVRIDRDGNDPAFTIYLPPEVSHWEAVDAIVYGKLSALIKELNVQHRRSTKIGRDALGYARGDREIVTKFGGAEGVLSHELGHILDARYGLRREIERGIGKAPRRVVEKGKQAGKSVPDYKAEPKEARGRRKTLHEELRQLANLRRETMKGVPTSKQLRPEDKKYLHSWPEKMANMVEAYIHLRPRFKKVAPGIFKIFDGIVQRHPELHALRDMAPSLSREEHTTTERLPGFPIGGYWYAPRNAAAVWRNHLSRGLRGNPLFDAYMAPAQAAQQLMLGLSGFHATVISTEGAFSELAAAAENLINAGGSAGAAVRHLGKAPVSPATTTRLGMQVMQEYRKPGTHPELAKVLDAMIAGGYRGKTTSEFWTGERIGKFKKALQQTLHNDSQGRRLLAASKLPFNAVWAAIETTSIPVLAKFVPLMKTGALYSAAAEKVAKLDAHYKGDVPIDVLHREMRDLVKEMDYRFGQVDYDNFFINNAVKNLAQMVFLAPGWTFGTVALAERGLADIAKAPKRALDRVQHARLANEHAVPTPDPDAPAAAQLRHAHAELRRGLGMPPVDEDAPPPGEPPPELLGKSAAYWIFGAVLGTVVINGVLTYLHTGERPKGKDFWAFRDGTTDQDGNANRQTIPGYLMKDIYGWSHHPVDTFRNKLSPMLSFLSRVATNRTYSGDQVYDEHASLPTKAKQVGKELVSETAPLSVQNYRESRRRDEGVAGAAARNLFGITPAKREFQRTPAQNLMQDMLDKRGHTSRTPDERDQADARRAKRAELLTLPRSEQRTEVRQMIKSKEVTARQGLALLTRSGEHPLVSKFKQLTADEALKVWNAPADAREKELWRPILRTKLIAAGRRTDIPPDAQKSK